jgi:hypothetical protein
MKRNYTTVAILISYDTKTWISGGTCRIKLLANALSGDGVVIGNVDISDGSAYELDYDVEFHSLFDFSRGGKIGFDFLVGIGNTGGDPGTKPRCASRRVGGSQVRILSARQKNEALQIFEFEGFFNLNISYSFSTKVLLYSI